MIAATIKVLEPVNGGVQAAPSYDDIDNGVAMEMSAMGQKLTQWFVSSWSALGV